MFGTTDKNNAEVLTGVDEENISVNTEKNSENEKPYKFEELKAKHIPLMTNVIKAIGINEFKSCLNGDALKDVVKMFTGKAATDNDTEGEDVDTEGKYTAIGISLLPSFIDIADIILNNIEKCENALIKLFSKTSNLSAEEIENLSIADFASMVIDFTKKEEFPDFFKVVSKLFK